jgi:hypothetical protein
VLARTVTNGRIVWICPVQFQRTAADWPELAEIALLHEALRTVGLAENPPSSRDIAVEVFRECPI